MSTELGNLAAYPNHRLRYPGLDLAGEHIHLPERTLDDLDEVLDPEQRTAGHDRSTRHPHQRAEREQQTLTDNATRQALTCTDFAGERLTGQVEPEPLA